MCDDSEQDIKPKTAPRNVTSDLHRIETKHRTKERNNNYRTKKRNKQCTKQNFWWKVTTKKEQKKRIEEKIPMVGPISC